MKFALNQQLTDKYKQVWTITARTAKMVTATGNLDGEKKFRVKTGADGVENFKPYGSYSMAPVLFAK